jgi:hypothetical protein
MSELRACRRLLGFASLALTFGWCFFGVDDVFSLLVLLCSFFFFYDIQMSRRTTTDTAVGTEMNDTGVVKGMRGFSNQQRLLLACANTRKRS